MDGVSFFYLSPDRRRKGAATMSTTYWSDFAGYLTSALAEYEEIVGQATEDISKIITTFELIIFRADLLILSKSELPPRPASGPDVEVRRLALDTIGQAASIRDSMQHVHQETQEGLTRVKEMTQAFKGSRFLSTAEVDFFVQEIGEVEDALEQIRVKSEDLIPAAMAMLERARVLQKEVGLLAESPGKRHPDQGNYHKNTGGHRRSYASCEGCKTGRNRELHRLISLAHQKYREN
jgi:hypothetical protein